MANSLKRPFIYIMIKAFLFFGVYLLFHLAYRLIPLPFFISAESVWEHLKGGFFTAFFISLFDLLVRKQWGPFIPLNRFLTSRLAGILTVPFIIFILYYTVNSWTGKLDSSVPEMIIVIAITILSAFLCYIIENELLDLNSQALLWVNILCFFLLAYLFLRFTYELPFYPLFQPVE